MSRRRLFLRQLSLGAGALSLVPDTWASLAKASPLDSDKKLGVALVGLGSYSTNQLAPALQQSKHCRLAGVVSGSKEKAGQWAKKYGLAEKVLYNYDNFDRVADNPDIDIVYVVLPNSMHAEYTIRAAKAGKHVICEKPMATTVADAEAMIAACKEANRRLFIGYRLHYEPFNRQVRAWAQEKPFGDITHLETNFGFGIGDPNQWRLNKVLAGGGPLMDVGIYALQGSRYATGMEPVAVTAQFFSTGNPKCKEVEETLLWQLEFPGGIVCNSSTTYNFYIERLRVFAENGHYELSPAYGYGPLKGFSSKGAIDLPHTHHQTLQLDAMAESILNNTPTTATGEEGLRDMKIMEAIYRAAETGRRISLS